jgi:GNAT superfamily N-acetyltransferase
MTIWFSDLRAADIPHCAALLESLPEWFGIESARRQYIADLATHLAFGVYGETGVIGFISLLRHNAVAAEIQVMAVERRYHRGGVGRALVDYSEQILRRDRVEYLQVKTLGPSHPDLNYAATRAFYQSLGFRPLEETTAFWGEEQPCLLMVKKL